MKTHTYLFLLLTVGLFSGCAVTIPQSDSTPPTFIFEITSGLPGGTLRITSEDDLRNKRLNLRRNTLYRFRLSGSDQGGLAALKLLASWPTTFLELSPDSTEYDITTEGELYRILNWRGRRSDPSSGYVIAGKIHTIMYNQSYAIVDRTWKITATDFGGASGSGNSTRRILRVGIVDDTQELGLVDL